MVNLNTNLGVNRLRNWQGYLVEDKFTSEIHVQNQILPVFDTLKLEVLRVFGKNIPLESIFYKLCRFDFNNRVQINF